MIKIGPRMAGRAVVCPQCGSRLAVPFASDPAAEALYQEQRARRAAEKAAGLHDSPPRKTLLGGIFCAKSTTPSAPAARPLHPRATGSASDEEIDRWLDTLWTTPAEATPDAGASLPTASPPAPDSDFPAVPVPPTTPYVAGFPAHFGLTTSPTSATEAETGRRDYDSGKAQPYGETSGSTVPADTEPGVAEPASLFSRSLLKTGWQRLALLNLFIGFVLGIAAHSEWIKYTHRSEKTVLPAASEKVDNEEDAVSQSGILACRGELLYLLADGTEMPDADAVVIFLPQNRPPTILFSARSLAPGQETRKTREGAQSVEETGGAYVRTDTSGRFDAILSESGQYLLVLISSHVRRDAEDDLPRETADALRRFFNAPEELIGPYQYACRDISVSAATAPITQRFGTDQQE